MHLRNCHINLEKVERQSDDAFVRYLNEVRLGILSREFKSILDGCLVDRKPPPPDGIIPTKLYSINKEVDKENLERLAELPGEIYTLEAEEKFLMEGKELKAGIIILLKAFMGNFISEQLEPNLLAEKETLRKAVDVQIPSSLDFKIGAQVIFFTKFLISCL